MQIDEGYGKLRAYIITEDLESNEVISEQLFFGDCTSFVQNKQEVEPIKDSLTCLDSSKFAFRGNVYDLKRSWLIITLEKCQNQSNTACAGSDEEVDDYWKDMLMMTFNYESYVNYTNIEQPINSKVNWNAMQLDPNVFNHAFYGVKISQLESEQYMFNIFGEKTVHEYIFVEDVFQYTDYAIDIDETFLESTNVYLESPILVNMLILHPRGEVIQRSIYEFFQMLGDIGGFNDGLQMCLGYIVLMYNSRRYFMKLNLSVFRISPNANR